MPSRAADRLIADAQRAGAAQLRRAIEEIADLELASRGGASGIAGEDTAALTAIERIGATWRTRPLEHAQDDDQRQPGDHQHGDGQRALDQPVAGLGEDRCRDDRPGRLKRAR